MRKRWQASRRSQDHPELSGSEAPLPKKAHDAKDVLNKRCWRELYGEDEVHNEGGNGNGEMVTT